jgi:hypothetical protein
VHYVVKLRCARRLPVQRDKGSVVAFHQCAQEADMLQGNIAKRAYVKNEHQLQEACVMLLQMFACHENHVYEEPQHMGDAHHLLGERFDRRFIVGEMPPRTEEVLGHATRRKTCRGGVGLCALCTM